jgi:hypothetical protein
MNYAEIQEARRLILSGVVRPPQTYGNVYFQDCVVCHKILQPFITYSPHERFQRHKVIK